MKTVYLSVSLLIFSVSSCGSTEDEKNAAVIACECAQDKSIFGISSCFANTADSLGLDPGSLGYDRAIKNQCPETYQRVLDFSKGKK